MGYTSQTDLQVESKTHVLTGSSQFSSDPWIGLVDGDMYTAMENGRIEVN